MRTEKVYDTKCCKELTIHIGKNAKENWELFESANPFDYWFHLDDYPSCHVKLQLPTDTPINNNTIMYAASLCKSNSPYAKQNKIKVIYTQYSNVTKGDAVGSVVTKKVKSFIL